ncbi:diguanylate cyclase DgcJ [Klebsiella aerogenes]|nr:diguanylate cyclase DgcJ [Klebsiella aerogenes]
MKLQHSLLSYFISAGVIVLTSSFLVYELVVTHRDMSGYMRYIIEKGESTFLYDKYQNQLIISQFVRKLDTPPDEEQFRLACRRIQHQSNISGLNIAVHNYPQLHGTLSTSQADCQNWRADLPALWAFDRTVTQNALWQSQAPAMLKSDKRFRYYVDLANNYVYFYTPVKIKSDPIQDWNFLQDSKLGMTQQSLDSLRQGRSLISTIYVDTMTGKNILSFLTPVYYQDRLKGVVMVDVTAKEIEKLLYTADRPLVWQYLDITLKDSNTGAEMNIHRSQTHFSGYADDSRQVAENLRISLSLDVMYFLLSSWELFLFYLLSTAALLHLVRIHFRLYSSISKENISDALTGLYNRKILTSTLELRLQKLTGQGVNVGLMALDCDELKTINDTWGHDAGDRAIILLAQAISAAIRSSDYGIRLGGDEFFLILIDYPDDETQNIPARIRQYLALHDRDRRVNFSWGACNMLPGQSLSEAMKIADARLYVNKKQKNAPDRRR